MLSLVINGVLGFAMVLALMFCIGNVDAALGATETLGYPFLEIFLQAVNSVTGACLMAGLVVVLGICSTVGDFAAASRMLWSFSRDRGTPFWQVLSKVSPLPRFMKQNFDLTRTTARSSHFNTHLYNRGDNPYIDAPVLNHPRLFSRFQQHHFAKRCRPLLVLSFVNRTSPLETFHRCHQTTQ